MASREQCWVVEDYELRPVDPGRLRERPTWVSLHAHSCHSTENIASLNWVVALRWMRPLSGVLQSAFGLAPGERLDYREVTYHPPITPEDVLAMEREKAARLGFRRVIFGLTDHDEVAGSLALRNAHPEDAGLLPIGEELSLSYRGHVFHLGVTGLNAATAPADHASLRALARGTDPGPAFEHLRGLGSLVVLNHPLLPWADDPEPLAVEFLRRHGSAIDALELNGMRTPEENQRVLGLARAMGKPVVGGGDAHLLVASAAACASDADSFTAFVEEVREGRTLPIVTRDYFAPLAWKLTLRVLAFIAQYRRIAQFRGEPVADLLSGRRVLLDPVGAAARLFLHAMARLGRLS